MDSLEIMIEGAFYFILEIFLLFTLNVNCFLGETVEEESEFSEELVTLLMD